MGYFSMSREDKVMEFHKAMDLDIDTEMTIDSIEFRMRLIWEELVEFIDETEKVKGYLKRGVKVPQKLKENLLKELSDLQYVVSGFAVTYGLPLQPAFNIVHKSNMTKLDPETGRSVKDRSGKIVKGKGYKPADLSPLFHK